MTPLLLLVMCATPEVPIKARTVAVVDVTSPRGWSSVTPTSTFIDIIERVVESKTELDVRSVEQVGADASILNRCPVDARFSCWIDHLRTTAGRGPKYLLTLAVQAARGGDRLRMLLVDLEAARRVADEVGMGQPERRQLVEDRIFEIVLRSDGRIVATSTSAIFGFVEETLDVSFGPLLDEDGVWGGLGQVTVRDVPRDTKIVFGDRAVKRLDLTNAIASDIHLIDVPPGRHRLGVGARSQVIEVAANHTTTVFVPKAPRGQHVARTWASVVGAVVGATGVAMILSAAVQSTNIRHGCVVRGDSTESCSQAASPGIGFDSMAAPTTDVGAVTGAPSWLALGGGFVAAGGTATVGSLFIGDEDSAPWTAIVAAVIAGVVTFGIVTIAEAR